jgi:hypothetical protein
VSRPAESINLRLFGLLVILAVWLLHGVACKNNDGKDDIDRDRKRPARKNEAHAVRETTQVDADAVAEAKAHLAEGGTVDDVIDSGRGYTRLHVAASKGWSSLASFLIATGANVNAKAKDGRTPLHLAAREGHEQVAAILIAKGAAVNAQDKNGLASLHFAAGEGHTAIAALLIENGADVHLREKHSATPLHAAADRGHRPVAELLIAAGADLNAKVTFGFTALDLARIKKHKAVEDLLVKHAK